MTLKPPSEHHSSPLSLWNNTTTVISQFTMARQV
jgi:hypothetical protein